MVTRGGNKRVKAFHVKSVNQRTIDKIVSENIPKQTVVYTDEYKGYKSLINNYQHSTVNHGKNQYVKGLSHTNNIENFWSIFKRGYVGLYHYMSRKHLQRYINEYVFRYNKCSDFLSNYMNRITYKELVRNESQ